MRVSKAQFQENREKILKAAGWLFRERGFDAVGVADVMKAAGLTHGGFYGHFKSKDDLIAQAAVQASDKVVERWSAIAEEHGPGALDALGKLYLGEAHLKAPGAGCLVAALGSEIARRPAEGRSGITASIKRVAALLQKAAPGRTEAQRRKQALAAYSSWVGAMVLARMSDDEAFSREVLEAVAEA
jgi:TetR/AcrR family transcriptional repressor of nem operon